MPEEIRVRLVCAASYNNMVAYIYMDTHQTSTTQITAAHTKRNAIS